LPQQLHEVLILETQQGRIIGHIARDATAIEARESLPQSHPQKKRQKYQRRPKRAKACQRGTRLDRQRKQALAEQLANAATGMQHRHKERSPGLALVLLQSILSRGVPRL